jgi:redox-sensitive bicupin YhaK (pirin superfamily)
MFYYRAAGARGKANFGWLNSQHTFSFGDYYDPDHMGISVLRVINDDIVAPSAGFGEHGHRDMEIISYILEGSIEHKDSMGNHFIVPAGDVQKMSAGTGVMHSEFNASKTEPLKLLQIWISPNVKGIKPSYEQMPIKQSSTMTPLVTSNGRDGSLSIQQDTSLSRLQLKAGESYELIPQKLSTQKEVGYLHIIEGYALADQQVLNGQNALRPGDGLGIIKDQLTITAGDNGLTALWFELPSK